MFSITSKSNSKTCQVFLLYIIASWTIASVKHFYLTDGQYSSCKNVGNASCVVKSITYTGHCLHFRTENRKPGTAYLFHPHNKKKKPNFLSKITKITSTPTSSKPTKIKHFTTFNTIKKSLLSHPKIPLNHYKSSTFSNSTENTIFNKEITHQNQSIYNSPTT